MLSVTTWPAWVAALLCAVAAFTDARARLIPNWLTLPALAIALGVHGLSGGAVHALWALCSALLCFAPSYFLFCRGALGGGDVKLFAALGALLGARDGLEVQLTAFALIAAFTLWSSAWNGKLLALLSASFRATLHLLVPSRFVRPEPSSLSVEQPMGLAILVAVVSASLRSGLP